MAKRKKEEPLLKKPLSRDVTLRFMMISGEIIMINRHAGSIYKTRTAFCASLGMAPSQFNAYEKGQNVTVEHLALMCQVHGVSGHWLLTGEGPTYHMSELASRLKLVEEGLREVQTKLMMNQVPKK